MSPAPARKRRDCIRGSARALALEAARREREALRDAEDLRKALDSRVETRKHQLRQHLDGEVEDFATRKGQAAFSNQLRLLVEREAWAADFMTAPIEDCPERIRRGLDLPGLRKLDTEAVSKATRKNSRNSRAWTKSTTRSKTPTAPASSAPS